VQKAKLLLLDLPGTGTLKTPAFCAEAISNCDIVRDVLLDGSLSVAFTVTATILISVGMRGAVDVDVFLFLFLTQRSKFSLSAFLSCSGFSISKLIDG
jgi:hypothetical protein